MKISLSYFSTAKFSQIFFLSTGSFYGLVDPAATPDNGNSSRVNELTRSVSIRNGETYIKALDKEI